MSYGDKSWGWFLSKVEGYAYILPAEVIEESCANITNAVEQFGSLRSYLESTKDDFCPNSQNFPVTTTSFLADIAG